MNVLFLLNRNLLIALIMFLTITIGLQVVCLSLNFFSFSSKKKMTLRIIAEASILFNFFILLYDLALTLHNVNDGFTVFNNHNILSYIIVSIIIISNLLISIFEKNLVALIAPVLAFINLPTIGNSLGTSYPVILQVSILFFFLRTLNQMLLYIDEKNKNLSSLSIKEAIDNMNMGILFCKTNKHADGQIMLANIKMQNIFNIMTGEFLQNGKYFYNKLLTGEFDNCQKENNTDELIYTLPDKSVWKFNLETINLKREKTIMMTASEITEIKKIGDKLFEQNKDLKNRNTKLKQMINNIESICKAEQMIQAKNHVHDVLGQQISFILRSVREHKEPNEQLLKSFADGLPQEIKNVSYNPNTSLKMVANSFRDLGVNININGDLPNDDNIKNIFYKIITEGITNSVRHGYANEITVNMDTKDGFYNLTIMDNGQSQEEKIFEGGGFSEIRKEVSSVNGKFSYEQKPYFKICVSIPIGGNI